MSKAPLRLFGPWFLLVILVVGTSPCLLSAQQAQPAPPAAAVAGEQQPQAPPAKAEAVKAYTLPPEKYEKAIAYSRANYRLYFIGVA